MTIYRARVMVDLLYEADKPLSSPNLVGIANKTASAVRTVAVEDLDKKINVRFNDELKHQTAHHHDATAGRCRQCVEHSGDGLGPIEE